MTEDEIAEFYRGWENAKAAAADSFSRRALIVRRGVWVYFALVGFCLALIGLLCELERLGG